MVLRSVGVLSAGKVSGVLFAFIGLLGGAFMALASLAGVAVNLRGGGLPMPALFLGVGALILLPIFYGVVGFISGIIYAALYNLIAALVGGLELEFDQPTMIGRP